MSRGARGLGCSRGGERGKKEEGRENKEEGRENRKREEGRENKEEGRGKREKQDAFGLPSRLEPVISTRVVFVLASSFLVIFRITDVAILWVERVDRLPRTAGFGTLCEIGAGLERLPIRGQAFMNFFKRLFRLGRLAAARIRFGGSRRDQPPSRTSARRRFCAHRYGEDGCDARGDGPDGV